MKPFDITLFISTVTWWIFIVYWLIAARKAKRTVERQTMASRLVVLLTVGGGCVLLFSSINNPSLGSRLLPGNLVIRVIGNVCSITGITLAIWARRTLGRNWSGTITLKEDHELIQTGPYRFVRHPIYTAFFLMFLGTAIVVGKVPGFIGFVMTCFGFSFKLRQEESLMIRHFGKQYVEYKSRVRAVVPWVL